MPSIKNGNVLIYFALRSDAVPCGQNAATDFAKLCIICSFTILLNVLYAH